MNHVTSKEPVPPVEAPVTTRTTSTAVLAAAEPSRRGHTAQRPDIQGLRALAVLLVIVYHLQPDRVPGGFVGVDVFFVISGYLIVGSLAREASASGTIRLKDFYARRIRRLLPAATVVLVAVVLATLLLLPISRWRANALDAITSALQVQNWALAFGAGTYDNATVAVSPLQHFWSLAVEEQFYLLAPVLLLLAVMLASRLLRRPEKVIVAVLAVVAVASFAHSVTFSYADHNVAYFSTTTRIWELALGGLAALAVLGLRGGAVWRAVVGWGGLLAIGCSALVLNTSMAFPGWLAAVPVLGTVAILLSAPSDVGLGVPDAQAPRGTVTALLSIRSAGFIGDISYSLYLWHWPVIVFWISITGHEPTKWDAIVLTPLLIGLAWVSTTYIETPFRKPRVRRGGRRQRRPVRSALVLAAAFIGTSVVVAGVPLVYVTARAAAAASVGLDADHPGGAEIVPEVLPGVPAGIDVVPDPLVARDDRAITMSDACDSYEPGVTDPRHCTFGDAEAGQVAVLLGDSHASQFSTALSESGTAYGWRIQALVRAGCPFNAEPLRIDGDLPTGCIDANVAILDEVLALRPSMVVTSAMVPAGYEDELGWSWDSGVDVASGYRQLWQPLVDAGIRVVVIRDTPLPSFDGPDCVARNGANGGECATARDAALPAGADPLVQAAQGMKGVTLVDLSDHLCNARSCPAVVGNVLVYRDNHVTDTFARSLGGVLSREVGLI